jgi:hypothetical protein
MPCGCACGDPRMSLRTTSHPVGTSAHGAMVTPLCSQMRGHVYCTVRYSTPEPNRATVQHAVHAVHPCEDVYRLYGIQIVRVFRQCITLLIRGMSTAQDAPTAHIASMRSTRERGPHRPHSLDRRGERVDALQPVYGQRVAQHTHILIHLERSGHDDVEARGREEAPIDRQVWLSQTVSATFVTLAPFSHMKGATIWW